MRLVQIVERSANSNVADRSLLPSAGIGRSEKMEKMEGLSGAGSAPKIHFWHCRQSLDERGPAEFGLALDAIAEADG